MREDGRSSVHRLVQEGRDRVAASDLGLNRLRTAVGVVVAVGTTLGVEWVLARLAGVGSRDAFSAVLFGAVVAVTGSVGLSSGPSRQKVLTVVASVVALGAGVVLGAAVFRDTGLLLGVFVVVLFAAVYVRRFGQPFFVAGMMAWTGYFFTSLLGASFDRLPWLILSATVAVVWVLLLSLTVLKENPECTLRRTLRALIGRAAALRGRGRPAPRRRPGAAAAAQEAPAGRRVGAADRGTARRRACASRRPGCAGTWSTCSWPSTRSR